MRSPSFSIVLAASPHLSRS